MTQRELSVVSGITVNTISGAERGGSVSLPTAHALAKALEVELTSLVK